MDSGRVSPTLASTVEICSSCSADLRLCAGSQLDTATGKLTCLECVAEFEAGILAAVGEAVDAGVPLDEHLPASVDRSSDIYAAARERYDERMDSHSQSPAPVGTVSPAALDRGTAARPTHLYGHTGLPPWVFRNCGQEQRDHDGCWCTVLQRFPDPNKEEDRALMEIALFLGRRSLGWTGKRNPHHHALGEEPFPATLGFCRHSRLYYTTDGTNQVFVEQAMFPGYEAPPPAFMLWTKAQKEAHPNAAALIGRDALPNRACFRDYSDLLPNTREALAWLVKESNHTCWQCAHLGSN